MKKNGPRKKRIRTSTPCSLDQNSSSLGKYAMSHPKRARIMPCLHCIYSSRTRRTTTRISPSFSKRQMALESTSRSSSLLFHLVLPPQCCHCNFLASTYPTLDWVSYLWDLFHRERHDRNPRPPCCL